MIKLKIIAFMLIVGILDVNAQDVDQIFLNQPKYLKYTNELPKNLLSSRTAVFINSPSGAKGQKTWKEIAAEAHKGFKKAGIDAVAYYHLKDVFSGSDASKAFAADLVKREIKNIIIIANDSKGNGTDYAIIITPFSGNHDFISHNQTAWKEDDKDLGKIIDNLYRQVSALGLEKSNYLIIDQPEFFEDTKINKGKNYESFLSDLKLDLLAVPKFEIGDIPEQKPEGPLNAMVEQKIGQLKESLAIDNKQLEGIMTAYPFKYEIVDGSRTEEQLRKAGFQYILLRLNTSDQTVRELLNYSAGKNAAQQASNYKKVIRNEPVYKYYIRHIHSGDIYLGNEWDAAETWQEALEKHIFNLKKELKVTLSTK